MHLLRQDIIIHTPGCHLGIKWSKTNQPKRNGQWMQLPQPNSHIDICPVRAFYQLLKSRSLAPNAPIFTDHSGVVILDTTIRDTMKKILHCIGIPTQGHSFHTFRCSDTCAFNNNTPQEHIMHHRNWKNDAIWNCIQQTSTATTQVPATFANLL